MASLSCLAEMLAMDVVGDLAQNPGRDGGTGRRSGLKIRRGQPRGGSTPPPGTILNTNIICEIRGLPRSLGALCLGYLREILH
jgi:hypothetical protein